MDVLLCHVHVNAIADYYDVPQLVRLANSRIQHILQTNWVAHSFPAIVHEVLNSNGDKTLQDWIAYATADHIQELIELDGFSELELTSTFVMEVLRNCAKRIREAKLIKQGLEAQVKVLKQLGRIWKGCQTPPSGVQATRNIRILATTEPTQGNVSARSEEDRGEGQLRVGNRANRRMKFIYQIMQQWTRSDIGVIRSNYMKVTSI